MYSCYFAVSDACHYVSCQRWLAFHLQWAYVFSGSPPLYQFKCFFFFCVPYYLANKFLSPAFSCPVLQFSGNVSVPRKACGLAQVNGRVILQYWCPTPAVLILLTCPKKLSSSSDAEIQSIPLHTALTRSSAIAEGPRDAPCHKPKCRTNVRRIAFDKSCIRRMTFKVIQCHWKWHK